MKPQPLLIIAIFTMLISCNFHQLGTEYVENKFEAVKAEMESDLLLARSDFEKTYNQTLQGSSDSVLSKNVQFHSSISNTANFIDSLQTEMNKLDGMDPKNIELVNNMFITNGLGNSVFNQLNNSYSLAIEIAHADTTKLRLSKFKETFSEENKRLFFELNNPKGVYIIMNGIETELFKDATKSLSGRKTK